MVRYDAANAPYIYLGNSWTIAVLTKVSPAFKVSLNPDIIRTLLIKPRHHYHHTFHCFPLMLDKMNSITINDTNPTLSSLIDKVNESQQATLITVDNNKKAVLLSVEEWNSIQETLYLLSIPGVKDDLIKGRNTDWKDCTPLDKVEW